MVEWVSSLGHLQYLVHCTITDNGGLQCQNIKWCKHKLDLQREPQSRTKQNIASTNESCVKWDLCWTVKIAIKVLGCVDSRYHPLMMLAGLCDVAKQTWNVKRVVMFIRDAIQRSHNINGHVNWGAGSTDYCYCCCFHQKNSQVSRNSASESRTNFCLKAGPNFSFKRFYRRRALGCV